MKEANVREVWMRLHGMEPIHARVIEDCGDLFKLEVLDDPNHTPGLVVGSVTTCMTSLCTAIVGSDAS